MAEPTKNQAAEEAAAAAIIAGLYGNATPPATAGAPAQAPAAGAPPATTPVAAGAQAPTSAPSGFMDDARWNEFAEKRGGVMSIVDDPKDEYIDTTPPATTMGVETGGVTRTKEKNPNPKKIVTFNNQSQVTVRTPGPGVNKYAIVDGGTALQPPKPLDPNAKTPTQVAADVAQSEASARNLNANAAAQEATNRGELTEAQKVAVAQKERDQKLSEIQRMHEAGQLDLQAAKNQVDATFQEFNAQMAAYNAALTQRNAMSNERGDDSRTATTLAGLANQAHIASLPYRMTEEEAENYNAIQNQRLKAAGIPVTLKPNVNRVPFNHDEIAMKAYAKVYGKEFKPGESILPPKTDFNVGQVPTPPTNVYKPGTANTDAARAALAGPPPAGPPATVSVAPPGGTNAAVDDPRMGMSPPRVSPTPEGIPGGTSPTVDDPRMRASFPPPSKTAFSLSGTAGPDTPVSPPEGLPQAPGSGSSVGGSHDLPFAPSMPSGAPPVSRPAVQIPPLPSIVRGEAGPVAAGVVRGGLSAIPGVSAGLAAADVARSLSTPRPSTGFSVQPTRLTQEELAALMARDKLRQQSLGR